MSDPIKSCATGSHITTCTTPDAEQPFCTRLYERLSESPNAGQRGLTAILLASRSTGETRLAGVAYKKDRRDVGLMINVCPFCGQSLEWSKKKGTTEKLPGLYIVMDRPPGPDSQFAEVEDETGSSVAIPWKERKDGLWELGPLGRSNSTESEQG